MDKQDFITAAADFPGATQRFKPEWDADLLEIGGKMFAMITQNKEKEDILTIKALPADNELLRAKFDYIIPGYYSNKEHWSSIFYRREVDEKLVMDLLYGSYQIVLNSLPAKSKKAVKEAGEKCERGTASPHFRV